MRKIYCGVDIGNSGFITTLDDDKWSHYEMPKIGKFVDVNALNKIFEELSSIRRFHECTIIVGAEDLHAIFGSSSKSTFSFGYICGVTEGLIVANRLPFTKIKPKEWQKVMWQGIPIQKKPSSTGRTFVNDTKLMSLMAAKRLFPEMDFRRNERCKVPDDNKVDSILITEYLRRNY